MVLTCWWTWPRSDHAHRFYFVLFPNVNLKPINQLTAHLYNNFVKNNYEIFIFGLVKLSIFDDGTCMQNKQTNKKMIVRYKCVLFANEMIFGLDRKNCGKNEVSMRYLNGRWNKIEIHGSIVIKRTQNLNVFEHGICAQQCTKLGTTIFTFIYFLINSFWWYHFFPFCLL